MLRAGAVAADDAAAAAAQSALLRGALLAGPVAAFLSGAAGELVSAAPAAAAAATLAPKASLHAAAMETMCVELVSAAADAARSGKDGADRVVRSCPHAQQLLAFPRCVFPARPASPTRAAARSGGC